MQVRGVDSPSHRVIGSILGCQLASTIEKECSRPRRPARSRVLRSLLEGVCDHFIRLVD
jgi:hypothetical protein